MEGREHGGGGCWDHPFATPEGILCDGEITRAALETTGTNQYTSKTHIKRHPNKDTLRTPPSSPPPPPTRHPRLTWRFVGIRRHALPHLLLHHPWWRAAGRGRKRWRRGVVPCSLHLSIRQGLLLPPPLGFLFLLVLPSLRCLRLKEGGKQFLFLLRCLSFLLLGEPAETDLFLRVQLGREEEGGGGS